VSVTVLSEYHCREGQVDEFIRLAHHILPAARRCQGCNNIYFTISQTDERHVILIGVWNSRIDHQNFIQHQADSGSLMMTQKLLEAFPSHAYLSNLDDF
jgi:heme-degrading monooxygenase HmoA